MTVFTPDSNNDIFHIAGDFVNQTSQHIFLTGKAGTGKTTFLKHISVNCYKRVLVAAPTGVAAINAGGVTIHSLFQLPFEPYIPNSRVKDAFKFGKAKIDLLRQVELLIIDEVSMLRADMLDAIDNTLRFIRRNALPFGGVQMLYIGDMFQLPPVVRDEEWNILKDYYESPFFFHAKVIEKAPPVYLELKKVYRQQDQEFIDLLNRVRNNCLTNTDLTTLNQRYQSNIKLDNTKKYITLTTHNAQADKINSEKLTMLSGDIHRYEGAVKGEFPDYLLPTDNNLQLKVGAQIMFIKNDLSDEHRYYNGKLAEITKLTSTELYALPEGAQAPIKIERETWRNVRYTLNKEKGEIEEEELGSFVQYPIRTAWAITIHKSQGLTFTHAVIDIASAFAAGQAYVALSRCTTLEGIILQSPITTSCIQTNAHAIAFSESELPSDKLLPLLDAAKNQFWAKRLLHYFDWKPLLFSLYEFKKLVTDKTSDEFKSVQLLAQQLLNKAQEQESTAIKFQKQLAQITNDTTKDTTETLGDRCTKASQFFYIDIKENILQPLQNHITGFSHMKKAKAYAKELVRIEENIIFFTMNLLNVRYHNKPLIGELSLPQLRTHNILTDKKSEKENKQKESKPRAEKGSSQKASLIRFKEGKTIAEIATERQLSETTITAHLIDFIKTGDLEISTFVPQNKIDVILPLVKEKIKSQNYSLVALKEQLGNEFSYNDIKAVINHWLWESTDKSKDY